VELKLDEEWREDLKPFDRFLVSLIGLPMLKRHGYGLFQG
jgi:hypothetical protein